MLFKKYRSFRKLVISLETSIIIIERVYFIYRLFILFFSTLSFLLFLYLVSWKYKRDYSIQYRYFALNYILYY